MNALWGGRATIFQFLGPMSIESLSWPPVRTVHLGISGTLKPRWMFQWLSGSSRRYKGYDAQTHQRVKLTTRMWTMVNAVHLHVTRQHFQCRPHLRLCSLGHDPLNNDVLGRAKPRRTSLQNARTCFQITSPAIVRPALPDS